MKCEFCGNNLGLEDETCPACGKPNRFAAEHNMDMKKFKNRYDSTQKEVIENSRRFNKLTIRVTVLAVMIALIAISIVVASNSYQIQRYREEKIVEKNRDEYAKRLDEMVAQREYIAVNMYSNANKLSYSDYMKDYRVICEISHVYWSFLEYTDYLFKEDSYMSDEEAVDRIADIAKRIHKYKEPTDYEKENYYNEQTISYVEDLSAHVDVLVQGYFNISDEDMAQFWEISEARRKILMEDGLKNEE